MALSCCAGFVLKADFTDETVCVYSCKIRDEDLMKWNTVLPAKHWTLVMFLETEARAHWSKDGKSQTHQHRKVKEFCDWHEWALSATEHCALLWVQLPDPQALLRAYCSTAVVSCMPVSGRLFIVQFDPLSTDSKSPTESAVKQLRKEFDFELTCPIRTSAMYFFLPQHLLHSFSIITIKSYFGLY